MPEFSSHDLARCRLEKSADMLISAKRDLAACDYASANNRAYYCIFHAMRAVLALDNIDFKKHSAVISAFNQRYVKTEEFERAYSVLITTASLIRTRSDYEDFYLCSKEDTVQLTRGAEQFHNSVAKYLMDTLNKE